MTTSATATRIGSSFAVTLITVAGKYCPSQALKAFALSCSQKRIDLFCTVAPNQTEATFRIPINVSSVITEAATTTRKRWTFPLLLITSLNHQAMALMTAVATNATQPNCVTSGFVKMTPPKMASTSNV